MITSFFNRLKEKESQKKYKKDEISFDKTFTITFGDQGENHAGMQKIGCLAQNGFSIEDILSIKEKFDQKGYITECYHLNDLLKDVITEKKVEEAMIVVVRNGLFLLLDEVENGIDLFFKEQDQLKKDTKALMRGRVVNKHARYNLCFSNFSQEPDFEKGKGTIVDFKDIPLLNRVKDNLPIFFGEKTKNFIAEGNYYYNPEKCGIGYHGDSERKMIIGIRVGKEMPLTFRWYYHSEIISPTQKIILRHGDIYFSSEKAVGFDWKKSSQYTLRHAAGCNKYIE